MIIHHPEIIHKDGHAILWAKIETSKERSNFPDKIWYRVPEKYAAFLNVQSDVFLVASLLGGMFYGENIQVRGSVSPRLAYHLDEYQFILNFRMPDVLKKVSIQYDQLATIKKSPKGVGSTFSGGVNSLFTVWKHLPERQSDPNFQITHGVFIHGFDILLSDEEHYQRLFNQFSNEATQLGIEIVKLETNMSSIIHQRKNDLFLYGPSVVSSGLVLPNLFQRFFIPSSWDYHMLQRTAYDTDPLLDGLLSTDTMDIIHHGSTYTRIEKTEEIADWEIAQNILWVCLDDKLEEHSWNCSRCEKCVRTMIPLYARRNLIKFKTFDKPLLKNWELLWYSRKFNLRSNFVKEMFPFLRNNKPALIPWMYLAVILGYIRHIIVKYMPNFLKNWLRRYGYFVTRDEAPDAYESSEITQIIMNSNEY